MSGEESKDQSAPCGCRRVWAAERWWQVVWCPDHHDGCPDEQFEQSDTAQPSNPER